MLRLNINFQNTMTLIGIEYKNFLILVSIIEYAFNYS